MQGATLFAGTCWIIAASALGFLVWNFPPARIFMGDAGSSTLGFLVAACSLWADQQHIAPLWVSILVFSPFIVDATVTLIRRLFRGEAVWKAHRSHYYQRLALAGWGHRRTVIWEYALMVACGTTAILVVRVDQGAPWVWAVLAGWALPISYWLLLQTATHRLARRMSHARDRERARPAQRHCAHDLLVVVVAWLGAYWLRFNLDTIPPRYFSEAFEILPFLLVIQGGAFWFFGLYRGVWRFASLPDLVRIGKAILIGTLATALLVFFVTRLRDVPRSVFPLYMLLLTFLVGGPRLLYRWYKDHRLLMGSGERLLVVGAGSGGEMLVRDLLRTQSGQYTPVGFVDDDRRKQGTEIHGFRVFGDTRSIPKIVSEHAIDLIVIAIPSATSKAMRRIVHACEKAGVPFRTLPGTQDIASGRASVQTLREVLIDDLLGREPVSLDWRAIRAGLEGRR